MQIETSFAISSPPERAYAFLLDVERVAPCVPGGELGPRNEDGSFPATVTVKLGPMRMVYTGKLRIAEQDDAAHRAVLSAKAREAGGQGAVDATMTMHVVPDGAGSRVDVATDLSLTGRAARMGRGIVEDVARRLVTDMASCLERKLDDEHAGASGEHEPARAASPPRPVSGFTLLVRAFVGRLRRIAAKGET